MRVRRLFGPALLIFLPLSGPAASAESPASASPDQTPLVTRTLANGLEVLVYPDAFVPMVTAELVVRNGSSYETPSNNGLAHLYEHLFWPDTGSGATDAPTLNNRGISFNASTREEVTNFYLVGPGAELRSLLAYLRNAVRTPDFSLERLAAQKEVVAAEIQRADANPYTRMSDEAEGFLFPRNRTYKSPLGQEVVVRNAFSSDLRRMRQRFVTPENSAIVVTGDCDPETVFGWCAEIFGDLDPASGPPPEADPGPPPSRTATDIIVSPQVEDVVVEFAWRGPGVDSDRTATYAADVLSEILRQPGARFQRTLVDSGLAVGTDIVYYTQRNVGISTLLVKCEPDKAKEALATVRSELAALDQPDYFTDQELQNARAAVIADDLFSREDLVRYSHSLGFWWASAGTDYLLGRIRATRRVSREDVVAYIRKYLQTDIRSVVAVVPSGPNRRAIRESDLKD